MKNIAALANVSGLGARKNSQTQTYLLNDQFLTARAAGAVNGTQAEPTGGTRTVTDTNSKISVTALALSVATGGVNNTDGLWYTIQTRVAGRMLLGTFNWTAGGCGFGWDQDQTGVVNDCIRTGNAGALAVLVAGTGITIGTFTTSTSYSLAILMRTTGHYYFMKGGTEFPNWTLLYINSVSTGNVYPGIFLSLTTPVFTATNLRVPGTYWLPTPLAYDTFTRANGALGSTESTGPDSQVLTPLAWTGSTWTISSNAAINTPVTLGSDIVLNGSFTTDTSNWTNSGTAPTIASVPGGQSGNCASLTNGSDQCSIRQELTGAATVGLWYQVSYYHKNGNQTGVAQIQQSANNPTLNDSNWTQYFGSFRAVSGASANRLRFFVSSQTAADSTLWDEITSKPLTLSELISSIATSTKDVIADVNITQSGIKMTQAGVVVNLDSAATPANFVVAYLDGFGNAVLDKCVAGVYTNVISAAITYSAGATLRVIKDGTSYRLFYNNAAVGSVATISDAGIISNTLAGMFSTFSGNSLDNFQLFPRGTNGEFNSLNNY